MDGVTSNIQDQLDNMSNGLTNNPDDFTIGKRLNVVSDVSINSVLYLQDVSINGFINVDGKQISTTEVSYLQGLTSNVQDQLDTIGTAILNEPENIIINKRLGVNDVSLNGNLLVDGTVISSKELSYLDGVTENINSQIQYITNILLAGMVNFTIGTLNFVSTDNTVDISYSNQVTSILNRLDICGNLHAHSNARISQDLILDGNLVVGDTILTQSELKLIDNISAVTSAYDSSFTNIQYRFTEYDSSFTNIQDRFAMYDSSFTNIQQKITNYDAGLFQNVYINNNETLTDSISLTNPIRDTYHLNTTTTQFTVTLPPLSSVQSGTKIQFISSKDTTANVIISTNTGTEYLYLLGTQSTTITIEPRITLSIVAISGVGWYVLNELNYKAIYDYATDTTTFSSSITLENATTSVLKLNNSGSALTNLTNISHSRGVNNLFLQSTSIITETPFTSKTDLQTNNGGTMQTQMTLSNLGIEIPRGIKYNTISLDLSTGNKTILSTDTQYIGAYVTISTNDLNTRTLTLPTHSNFAGSYIYIRNMTSMSFLLNSGSNAFSGNIAFNLTSIDILPDITILITTNDGLTWSIINYLNLNQRYFSISTTSTLNQSVFNNIYYTVTGSNPLLTIPTSLNGKYLYFNVKNSCRITTTGTAYNIAFINNGEPYNSSTFKALPVSFNNTINPQILLSPLIVTSGYQCQTNISLIGTGPRVLLTGTTYTPTAGTNFIECILVGGGGAGGGAAISNTASLKSAGGGGGTGGITYFTSFINESITYTYLIGNGGTAIATGSLSTSTASANKGGDGGSTSITISSTTYNANGGTGGASAVGLALSSTTTLLAQVV